MGRVFIEYIEQASNTKGRKATDLEAPKAGVAKNNEARCEGELIFACRQCQIHLADHAHFISKVRKSVSLTVFCCAM